MVGCNKTPEMTEDYKIFIEINEKKLSRFFSPLHLVVEHNIPGSIDSINGRYPVF